MNAHVHHQADSTVYLITEGAHVLVRIGKQSQFFSEAFTVQCPAFHIGILAAEPAEFW